MLRRSINQQRNMETGFGYCFILSGESLTMIDSIQTPEVVNGKVQDVVVRDNGSFHVPTREPEAELLIDSPNTSRHLIGCQGGYHGEGMTYMKNSWIL